MEARPTAVARPRVATDILLPTCHSPASVIIIIIIIIIDKTDAGLNGLYIRDITLICDVINMYNNY